MRYAWFALLIGCTSSSKAEPPTNVPDRFDQNLDVIVRSVTHPCGADADTDGDGHADTFWRYRYDANGRSEQDIARDATNAIVHQIDYTWDNAGNLTEYKESVAGIGFDGDTLTDYDSLGRRSRYQFTRSRDGSVLQRTTYDYDTYDDLGHPTHAAETFEDLVANTTRTLTRVYAYDDLGRRTSLDVHFSTGELYQGWQHAYDDAARTVTTRCDEPNPLRDGTGFTLVGVDSYDADFHLVGSHDESTPADGSQGTTTDITDRWDGSRELSETVASVGPGVDITTTQTYRYSCN